MRKGMISKVERIKLKNCKCSICGKDLTGIESNIDHYKPRNMKKRTAPNNSKLFFCNECHKKIIDALSDEHWDYRTASSIAKEVRLETSLVDSILTKDKNVRVSIIPSKNGEKLFALKDKISTYSDLWNSLKRLSSDKY